MTLSSTASCANGASPTNGNSSKYDQKKKTVSYGVGTWLNQTAYEEPWTILRITSDTANETATGDGEKKCD
jgi:hypothetical protein